MGVIKRDTLPRGEENENRDPPWLQKNFKDGAMMVFAWHFVRCLQFAYWGLSGWDNIAALSEEI